MLAYTYMARRIFVKCGSYANDGKDENRAAQTRPKKRLPFRFRSFQGSAGFLFANDRVRHGSREVRGGAHFL